jgi:hypothetical protein
MEVMQVIGTIVAIAFGGITSALSGMITARINQARTEERQDAIEQRLRKTEHAVWGNSRPGLNDTVARHDYQIGNLCEQVARIGNSGGGGV